MASYKSVFDAIATRTKEQGIRYRDFIKFVASQGLELEAHPELEFMSYDQQECFFESGLWDSFCRQSTGLSCHD